jgi:hypothetical protein
MEVGGEEVIEVPAFDVAVADAVDEEPEFAKVVETFHLTAQKDGKVDLCASTVVRWIVTLSEVAILELPHRQGAPLREVEVRSTFAAGSRIEMAVELDVGVVE